MGGEKPFDNPKIDNCEGSPPRGRGKALLLLDAGVVVGITPAWAGKRDSQWQSRAAGRDHPRAGGEKSLPEVRRHYLLGSPPHGRGKGQVFRNACAGDGITPAWAGKSSAQPRSGLPGRDHPRVGGEKAPAAGHCSTDTGSPPRGRGKGWHLSHGLLPCG